MASIYEPLPDAERSLRLLRIEPGWPADALQVQLVVVPDRAEAPPYDALSYVWGTAMSPDRLWCNGRSVSVTANLRAALHMLRPLPAQGSPSEHGMSVVATGRQRQWKTFARHHHAADYMAQRRATGRRQLLWIDALCIDQTNKAECAAQVRGMRSIYSAAETVRVWLGGQDKTDSDKMSLPPVLHFVARAERDESFSRTQAAAAWQPLVEFLEHPWFHRVWTVQELVLARRAVLLLDGWDLDWDPFARMMARLDRAMLGTAHSLQLGARGAHWAGLPLLPTMYVCALRAQPGRVNFLLPLLNDLRWRRATHPADHVFAVLGMATEVVHPERLPDAGLLQMLHVDYDKSAADVFRDAVWLIVLVHATLLPLTMIEHDGPPAVPGLPSWVPDWSRPARAQNFLHNMFGAHGGRCLQLVDAHRLDVLCAAGYHLERVAAVTPVLESAPGAAGEPLTRFSWRYPPQQEERDFVAAAWQLAQSRGSEEPAGRRLRRPYQSPADTLDALLYTLTGNRNEENASKRADETKTTRRSGIAWLQQYVPGFAPSLPGRAWHAVRETVVPGTSLAFQTSLLAACTARRFFVTVSGFTGIGPLSMRAGDLVAVLFGMTHPFVLRPVTRQPGQYQLVGSCYVHGIMDGELVQACEGEAVEVFALV